MIYRPVKLVRCLLQQHCAVRRQPPCAHLLSSARGDAAALHCPLGALRQPPFEPPQR